LENGLTSLEQPKQQQLQESRSTYINKEDNIKYMSRTIQCRWLWSYYKI